jgi:PTS system nitrogen regulatory IIA component
VKGVHFPGIGRFSAVTFGPGHGRPQLALTTSSKPAAKRIADLLLPADILLDVDVSSKSRLIDEIGRHMQRVHAMPQERTALGLSQREQIGSTGLGEGVAIPHARIRHLDRVLAAYMRLKRPIPFDAPDGKAVSDVLVLLVPQQATEEHLTLLAEAAQMLSDRHLRERLHLCSHPLQVKRLLEVWSKGVAASA